MRLEITVCYTILEKCFNNLDILNFNSLGKLILEELYKRKIILHNDLLKYYEEHFQYSAPHLMDLFQTFYQMIIIQAENTKILKNYKRVVNTNDDYLDLLINLCISSEDKILLIEKEPEDLDSLEKLYNITSLNSDRVLDKDDKNILNEYRLPIIRKVVRRGELSDSLSNWLSKFIKTESNFKIIDNYIFENRENFLTYFLKHVRKGSKIEIHTMLNNNNTEEELKRVFLNQPFDDWAFTIKLIENKKEQHAREIITDRYYIEIDKGMAVFGDRGKTHQANITICYKEEMYEQKYTPKSKVLV
jgi:hypothetical protein